MNNTSAERRKTSYGTSMGTGAKHPPRVLLLENFTETESFQFGNIANTPVASVETELAWEETSRKGSTWMKQVVVAPVADTGAAVRRATWRGSVVAPRDAPARRVSALDQRHPPKLKLPPTAQDDPDAEPTMYKVRMDTAGKIKIVYDEIEFNQYIIPWNSTFRRCWDGLIVVLVLYLCFNLPFSIAFEDYYFSKSFDTFMDVLFYIDIFLNFRTGFVHNGEHVTNPKEIAKHYLKTYFVIDVLASIPFEVLLEGLVVKTTRKSIKLLKWLKIPKLLRLGRIIKYLKRYGRYYFVFQAAMLTIFMIHLVGCMWMSIAEPCAAKDGKPCNQSEMEKLYFIALYMATMSLFGVTDVQSFIGLVDKTIQESSGLKRVDEYGRRLASYDLKGVWTNADTTTLENPLIGLPRSSVQYFDTDFQVNRTYEYTVTDYSNTWWSRWSILNPEKSYDVIMLYSITMVGTFVGVGLLVAIIGEASTFSLARVDSYNRFFGKVDRIKTAMSAAHIPEEIQYRVVRFFDYLWVHQKQGYELLSDPDIPNPLKKELALHLHGPLLSSLSLFSGLSSDCLYAVALRLKTHIYMPGDVIFLKGDLAQQLYFIRRGNIHVYLAEVDPNLALQPVPENTSKRHALSRVMESGDMPEEEALAMARKEGELAGEAMAKADTEAKLKAARASNSEAKLIPPESPSADKRESRTTASRPSAADTVMASSTTLDQEDDDKHLIKVMGPGSYFGEIALLTDLPRVCTVSSQGMSELNELDRHDFEEVMSQFPELAGEVVESAMMDYPGLRPHLRQFARQVEAQSRLKRGGFAAPAEGGGLPALSSKRVSNANLGGTERCSSEARVQHMQREVNEKLHRMEMMLEKLTAIVITNGRAESGDKVKPPQLAKKR